MESIKETDRRWEWWHRRWAHTAPSRHSCPPGPARARPLPKYKEKVTKYLIFSFMLYKGLVKVTFSESYNKWSLHFDTRFVTGPNKFKLKILISSDLEYFC